MDNQNKIKIKKMLTEFPAHDLGNKFLIITKQNVVKDFIDVVGFFSIKL